MNRHPPPDSPLLIGTRSSAMALAQADHVAELLRRLEPGLRTQPVPTTTTGDTWPGDLTRIGGKGLFVKAIDEQLQCGEADLAVHCLKDVPGDRPLPRGLTIAAVLPRADVHDVLVVPEGSPVASPAELPEGAAVATSAVRRKAQLLALRPDLRVMPVRGTVGTRLAKLDSARRPHTAADGDDGPVDAMVLARAGLSRLGLTARIRYEFSLAEMLPAVGAGVLALVCREEDDAVTALLHRLDDPAAHAEADAERSMLSGLRGHCNSPIAGHCTTAPDGRLTLHGMVFSGDGSRFVQTRLQAGPREEPAALGSRVCAELSRQGARQIIDG
ncbi:porphobilinogen deaminase 2 [Streptomyces daqingensis]|uniref:Hydroxymethylbilane synthase n=1 Tax=Streptomyces daqingensis TaxID=1472640 RepID=A0ABQ2MAZ9_9ACTN|nr:hydroxymethylbilane synthase [Streptomyces daqingensis]GGO49013.1 porphobilinogen deaminase 2 [Streptomyces daqingensis]